MPGKLTTEEYLEFVKQTFDEMYELIKKKNNDYTNGSGPFANFEQATHFGVDPLVGLSIRLGDKFQRLQTFCKTGSLAVQGEGVEDIFRDFIGYSCIALGMLKEAKRNEDIRIT